jgi:argininosuccinate lyase
MWSGRFRQPLDPEFEKWQRSFPYDRRLLPYELEASGAHARALERASVLNQAELRNSQRPHAIGQKAASSHEFLNDPGAGASIIS